MERPSLLIFEDTMITLTINTLIDKLYINLDSMYLDHHSYLYKTITRYLENMYGNFLEENIMINIFYYNNNEKKYIYNSLNDELSILHIDDIDQDFYLIKSELLDHEVSIIKYYNTCMRKCWDINYSALKIRLYMKNESKIINHNLQIINNNLQIALNNNIHMSNIII